MKNFIKLFFICVCFIFSLAANAHGINWHAVEVNQTQQILNAATQQEELSINFDHTTNAISAANNQKYEISATSSHKQNSYNGTLDKAGTQSKLLQQIFTANYNKTLYSTSHKISSYLKNEICTRAP